MKDFFDTVKGRIQRLILKLISPSFLTWGIITWLLVAKRVEFSTTEYLVFTAAVIGLKKYLERGGGQ